MYERRAMADDWKNMLYYGDNLPILRRYVAAPGGRSVAWPEGS